MADGVGAGHRRKAEALGDLVRGADLLVELHAMAAADEIDVRLFAGDPVGEALADALVDGDDGVGVMEGRLDAVEGALDPLDRRGDLRRAFGAQGELGAAGAAAAIDGEAGAVGAAIAHRREHAGGQPAEFRLERLVLEEKTDDAAHGGGSREILAKRNLIRDHRGVNWCEKKFPVGQ